jgi:hypothetical protein
MSYQTPPTFVAENVNGWPDWMLDNPMVKFMQESNKDFDLKIYDATKGFWGPEFTYTKSDGTSFSGEEAIKELYGSYALFETFYHEPADFVVYENQGPEGGYTLMGCAKLYVNLPGGEGKEKTVTDADGKKWDCVAPGGFTFVTVKDEGNGYGLHFKSSRILADPLPILKEAIKRGLVPVEAFTA